MVLKLVTLLLFVALTSTQKLPFFQLQTQLPQCNKSLKLSLNGLIALCVGYDLQYVQNITVLTRESTFDQFIQFQKLQIALNYTFQPNKSYYNDATKITQDGLMIFIDHSKPVEVGPFYIFKRDKLSQKFVLIQQFLNYSDARISYNAKYMILTPQVLGLDHDIYRYNEATNQFQFDQHLSISQMNFYSIKPEISNDGNVLTIIHFNGLSVFTRSQNNTFSQAYELFQYGSQTVNMDYVNFQNYPLIIVSLISQYHQQDEFTLIGQLNVSDLSNVTFRQITRIPQKVTGFSKNMKWITGSYVTSQGTFQWIGKSQSDQFDLIPFQSFFSQLFPQFQQNQFYYESQRSIDYLLIKQKQLGYSIYQYQPNSCGLGMPVYWQCRCMQNSKWDPQAGTCNIQIDVVERELDCIATIGYEWNSEDLKCQVLSCKGKEHVKYEEDQGACECEEGYTWQQELKGCWGNV